MGGSWQIVGSLDHARLASSHPSTSLGYLAGEKNTKRLRACVCQCFTPVWNVDAELLVADLVSGSRVVDECVAMVGRNVEFREGGLSLKMESEGALQRCFISLPVASARTRTLRSKLLKAITGSKRGGDM